MALSSTCIFEVRPTNGTTNAGGGFNPSGSSPGTDYSQQDAVQVAFNGTTITATTAGVSDTITITGYTVATTDNRNLIAITGGVNFTTGIYEIIAVNTGAGTWQLDRNCCSGAGTGMTGNMGGARKGYSGGTTTLQNVLDDGHAIHVKNEAWNESVTVANSAAAGARILHIGYNTARNDEPTGSNRPTNDRNSAGIPWNNNSTAGHILRNFRFTRSNSQGVAGLGATILENVRSYNNTTSGFGQSAGGTMYWNCEADTCTTSGIASGSNQIGQVYGSNLHDNTTNGIVGTTAGTTPVTNSIIESNAATGISLGAVAANLICGNTINNNTGASSDGLFLTTPTQNLIINNILSNNGRYGANATDGDSVWADYNNYYGNATAARNNIPIGIHDQTLDPQFTNAASGDYSIGTNLKALGFPGIFPGAVSTGYLDIGAVQRQESGGGGSSANQWIGG